MRKFLSILLASAMTACAFTSCGKTEDKKTDNSENQAIGRWQVGEYSIFDIVSEDEAYFCVKQDMSRMMYLDEDENIYFGSKNCGKDSYDFDGENFVLHAIIDNDLTMKKTDDSGDIFGEYEMISGTAYDIVDKAYNQWTEANDDDKIFSESGTRLFMTCNANSTMIEARLAINEFKIEDGKMTTGFEVLGTDEPGEVEYEIDGNTLVWKNKGGNIKTFTRVDE